MPSVEMPPMAEAGLLAPALPETPAAPAGSVIRDCSGIRTKQSLPVVLSHLLRLQMKRQTSDFCA